MGKKLYHLQVKVKSCLYGFEVYLDPEHIEGYRQDGIEISEIENIIPLWVQEAGLVRPWCFFSGCV